jgi:hypothetical protein
VSRAVIHLRATASRRSHPPDPGKLLTQSIQSQVACVATIHDDDFEDGIGRQRRQQ